MMDYEIKIVDSMGVLEILYARYIDEVKYDDKMIVFLDDRRKIRVIVKIENLISVKVYGL